LPNLTPFQILWAFEPVGPSCQVGNHFGDFLFVREV
jgi:hypothetical protein